MNHVVESGYVANITAIYDILYSIDGGVDAVEGLSPPGGTRTTLELAPPVPLADGHCDAAVNQIPPEVVRLTPPTLLYVNTTTATHDMSTPRYIFPSGRISRAEQV